MTIEWLLTLITTLVIVVFYFYLIKYLLGIKSNLFLLGSCFGILFFYVTPLVILSITGRFEKGIFLSVTDLKDIDITKDVIPVLLMHLMLFILGLTIYICSKFSKNKDLTNDTKTNYNISNKNLVRLIITVGVFYALFVARDLVSNNIFSGDAHWYESRHDSMSVENGSIINVIFTYLRNNARLVFFAALIYGWYKKIYKNDYIFLAVYLLAIGVDIYVSGNRFILAATGMLIAYILILRRKYLFIILCTFLAYPIAWLGTVFMSVRGVMYSQAGSLGELISLFKDKGTEANDQFIFVLINMVEGINFNTFVSLFYNAPKKIPFLLGETFITPVVFWIPRSIWENKPPRVGQIIGEAYVGNPDLSLVATFLGESWLNFGYLSLIIIPILFLVAYKFINSAISHLEPGVRSFILFLVGFTLMRASYGSVFVDVIVMSIYISLVLFILYRKLYLFGREVTLQ
ncbi:hypothetical protein [Raoultella ornithinolytica]|uniref:hypothetical protein n=3 Tax=Raoultella ornithinolytica TaxID=54291 RepID=UPI000F7124CC|nr:hypothetical protein [Raoultella ornithinolytica]MDH7608861.1 hypothetical protein [Raoultella ornithinolytica]VEB69389.1 Uncharacterised protein [Raoultella ornithinolytica]HDH7845988.1 hypothetical protein [Raoultella ornithinolytica]